MGESLASPSSNQYVDTVIHTTLQDVIRSEKLDPTHLPDYTFEYKDKTFYLTVHGKADYTGGSLNGLSKVKRYSECQGPKNVTAGTVINCTLAFDTLQTSYDGKVKYGVLPKVTIHAKGDVLYTIVDIEITKPANQTPRVTLKFRTVGTMSTNFSGLGPLNKHMKVLEDNYRGRVGSEVVNVISNRFRYAFEMAVANVPMPLR